MGTSEGLNRVRKAHSARQRCWPAVGLLGLWRLAIAVWLEEKMWTSVDLGVRRWAASRTASNRATSSASGKVEEEMSWMW